MRSSPISLWRAALALALPALVLATSPSAAVERAGVVAQASEDEDSPPPAVSPEPEMQEPAEEAQNEPETPTRLGESRQPDPFDVNEEGTLPPHPATAAYPNHDVVVCMAGCDGPGGTVVSKQRKQPPG
jgi:hypothetical protein